MFNLRNSTPALVNPSVHYIDFSSTPLAKWYSGDYALIIDDLFSPEECKDLIALAESTESEGGKGWQPAKLQNGSIKIEDQVLDTSYRHNDRILRFDHDAARQIYERVLPFVEKDIGVLKKGSKWSRIVAKGEFGNTIKVHGTWNLVGLNERLSFLRYGPGHFFREHLDGKLDLPDGRKSRVTIQIYLNGSDADVIEGGATRFRDPEFLGYDAKDESDFKFLDVEPKSFEN
ncbi:hypothetical protein BDP27DRAFT_922531 [Rhodocollybia butyracea]|uniref:Uncharacterized protein n=1 Tax=Rhodocollybia butyracea TaxID=206335 RepID=A0A9P5PNT7_9AGAR|nr:hypothetical protein BDP27DRAFT_922531 [Rhodocollybia butyracea]